MKERLLLKSIIVAFINAFLIYLFFGFFAACQGSNVRGVITSSCQVSGNFPLVLGIFVLIMTFITSLIFFVLKISKRK